MRLTDVASPETLLRLVQSVPSPKAEPIKLWLAKVGYERMQEMADPALSLDRARETWQKHGRSEKWIQQRMNGQETRNKLTVETLRKRPGWSWKKRPARASSPARTFCRRRRQKSWADRNSERETGTPSPGFTLISLRDSTRFIKVEARAARGRVWWGRHIPGCRRNWI
jgi:hypothetical protein